MSGLEAPAPAVEAGTELNSLDPIAAKYIEDKFSALSGDSDIAWVLVTGFLVFFMQAGFAMLEAGAVAPKNAKHILFKNMLDGAIGVCTWLVIGYPLAFGVFTRASGEPSDNAFLGVGQYFLSQDTDTDTDTDTDSDVTGRPQP